MTNSDKKLKRLYAALGAVALVPILIWLWLVPVERLRANMALEALNHSVTVPKEIADKEFIKDMKNGGTLVLVEYSDEPKRVYYYRFIGGELIFEIVKDKGAPKPIQGTT